MKTRARERLKSINESIVYRYFHQIERGDLSGVLELFAPDATIYEPFSKSGIIKGLSAIKSFLEVTIMINSTMKHDVQIDKSFAQLNPKKILARVSFEKENKMFAKFTFEFSDILEVRRIKSLCIEFL